MQQKRESRNKLANKSLTFSKDTKAMQWRKNNLLKSVMLWQLGIHTQKKKKNFQNRTQNGPYASMKKKTHNLKAKNCKLKQEINISLNSASIYL